MKIILSRKGFDSKSGEYPSPILPDGKFVSLPIPDESDIFYSNLKLNGFTYYEIMKQLGMKKYNEKSTCHLDPDICMNVLERPKNWRPIFGQIDKSQKHLNNQDVKEGDLFLFFGMFRKTKYNEGKLVFCKNDPEIHAIFGYLQINEIIRTASEADKIKDWMYYHPHIKSKERRLDPSNAVYIAREKVSWNDKVAGAGCFHFNEKLVLTKKGYSKSRWDLDPEIFGNLKITYHPNPWKENYFQSLKSPGQEFVIEENEKVENWAKELINNISI